jgi:hypothetical protein
MDSWNSEVVFCWEQKPNLMKHTNVWTYKGCMLVCACVCTLFCTCTCINSFCEKTYDYSNSIYTKIAKLETADFTLKNTMSKHVLHSFSIPEPKIYCNILEWFYFLMNSVFVFVSLSDSMGVFTQTNFIILVLNEGVSFHTFGSLPTTWGEL